MTSREFVGMTEEQRQLLTDALDLSRVSHRAEQGRQLAYLEAWDVIDTANRIFGFDGWSYEVRDLQGSIYGWTARVRVEWMGVHREDVGFCAFAVREGNEPRQSHVETAIKGAVSDGLKRALRSFGNQFGNSLYDKESPERTSHQGEGQQRNSGQRRGQGQRQQQGRQPQGNRQPPEGASKPQEPAYYKDLGLDSHDGSEILSGNALGFKAYVERHGIEWDGFLTEVLGAPTLRRYYEDGGNPKGATNAFEQYCADMNIEVQPTNRN